jgi:hypothetical protein
MPKRIIVGISGASGVIYGIRMLEILKTIGGVETHLVMSRYARMNIEIETTHTPQDVEALADVVHSVGNQAASISSGSFKTDGMVIAPCSMKTLSGIVNSVEVLRNHGRRRNRPEEEVDSLVRVQPPEASCEEMIPRHDETGLTGPWRGTPGESRPACPP